MSDKFLHYIVAAIVVTTVFFNIIPSSLSEVPLAFAVIMGMYALAFLMGSIIVRSFLMFGIAIGFYTAFFVAYSAYVGIPILSGLSAIMLIMVVRWCRTLEL